jgi:hypothetical protein
VNAQSCVHQTITGVGAQGNHLVLTPDFDDAQPFLVYSVEYTALSDNAW